MFFGLFAMAVGGLGAGNSIVGLGISAIAASVMGILCGGLYFGGKRQGLMSAGLIVAAIWHLISISAFAIPGFLLLLLAGIFAWLGRMKAPNVAAPD